MSTDPFKSPAQLAREFVARLSAHQLAYAKHTDRGEYRGFAALHDLFDANDHLADVLGASDTETANAIIEQIDAILLA